MQVVAILIGVIFLIFAASAVATQPAPASNAGLYDDIYKRWATFYNLDWKLLKAIAIVESNERASAVNPSDPSVGLMQVLCRGWPDQCTNTLYLAGWPPSNPQRLFDPEYNVEIASGILADNVNNFGIRKGIAVYNSNRARHETEPFSNQSYVDKVTARWGRL